VVALLVAAPFLLAPLVAAPRPYGDAGEYVLMAESWFRHGGPELQPGDVAALRAHYGARGWPLPEEAIVGNYHEAKDGRRYAYHFWGYSLLGVPLRSALEKWGEPLRALPLLNGLLFAAALAAAGLAWPAALAERLLLAGLLASSPALGFLLWPHPEVLSFAGVTLALVARERGALAAASAFAGMAALQNPPLVLLAGGLLALAVIEAMRTHRPARGLAAAAGLALALLPALFYSRNFGTWNLAIRPAEAAESLSFPRSLDLFFDLNLGLLCVAPVALLLYLALVVASLVRRRDYRLLAEAALVLALAFACTANSNWNNGTTGPSRYTTWIAPILFVGVVRGTATSGPERKAWRVALAAAFLSQTAILLARGEGIGREDHLEHSGAARLVLDHVPALYRPTHEVFWERTLHHEAWPEGPVVYEREGRCRKALVRRRDLEELRARCGPLPPKAEAALASLPRGLDEKRAFLYVDF
jgi:hypothetical protein